MAPDDRAAAAAVLKSYGRKHARDEPGLPTPTRQRVWSSTASTRCGDSARAERRARGTTCGRNPNVRCCSGFIRSRTNVRAVGRKWRSSRFRTRAHDHPFARVDGGRPRSLGCRAHAARKEQQWWWRAASSLDRVDSSSREARKIRASSCGSSDRFEYKGCGSLTSSCA